MQGPAPHQRRMLKGIPPETMATYYNPAYRPALEEELSSTDVKHAALSFRC